MENDYGNIIFYIVIIIICCVLFGMYKVFADAMSGFDASIFYLIGIFAIIGLIFSLFKTIILNK